MGRGGHGVLSALDETFLKLSFYKILCMMYAIIAGSAYENFYQIIRLDYVSCTSTVDPKEPKMPILHTDADTESRPQNKWRMQPQRLSDPAVPFVKRHSIQLASWMISTGSSWYEKAPDHRPQHWGLTSVARR